MTSSDPTQPPGLPTIQDEAAATPMWVPALGLGLFLVLALWLIVNSVMGENTDEGVEAPTEEAAAAAPTEA